MTQKASRENQNILGYTLKTQIGAGGYGEVWSAEAPGGLMKAVKIVFGYHDEQRATNELRSLDRIKDLRHPFLLNLERIDVVDGQLVIITELADKSLADEFDKFVEEGGKGIPREMLLAQLAEAADALDFITFKHSLLHLDIKPENLLMVGRHIKVADFGLVKDLKDVTQSLMSGLTPAYAAPELFDGKPCNTSDQYSLAIVYQEMLTGERPFPGTTPASLAAQHMNGRPNLRSLTKVDQQVIAKALSKDPNVRYKNCETMIQDLINRNTSRNKIRRQTVPSRATQGTDSTDVKIRTGTMAEATALISNSFVSDTPTTQIDAPNCAETESRFRPTLFIGIGNSGNQILKLLRQKVNERYTDPKSLPSLRFLCVDTDRNDITELSRDVQGKTNMAASETLFLPLRKPEDYRSRQKHLLSWISRRWIYNVPRSQQTEGIRPLGRLAFIDNFSDVCERLEEHAEKLNSLELLAETSEKLNMTPVTNCDPRVFVIASISGGTGSGMMADMAYTTKLILGENGISPETIHGLMLNSSSVQAGDPGLAATNSFAFLTELRHFNKYGFPGDPSQGLPEMPDDAPFDYSYFLDLGTNLSKPAADDKFDSIAEYLFLNTVSAAAKFFEACHEREAEINHFSLRSIGLAKSGLGPSKWNNYCVDQLGEALVNKWTTGTEKTEKTLQEEIEKFENSDLSFAANDTFKRVTEETRDLAEHPRVLELQQTITNTLNKRHNFDLAQLTELAEDVFGSFDLSTVTTRAKPTICFDIEKWAREQAESLGKAIFLPINKLLQREKLDLAAPNQIGEWFTAKIQEQRDTLATPLAKNREKQKKLATHLLKWAELQEAEESTIPIEITAKTFVETKLAEVRIAYTDIMLSCLGMHVNESFGHFKEYAAELGTMLATDFSQTEKPKIEDIGLINKIIAEQLYEKIPSLVGILEQRVYHDLIQDLGGYEAALKDSSFIRHNLPDSIRTISQLELSNGASRLHIDEVFIKNQLSKTHINEWVKSMEASAEPMLDMCGGRVLRAVCVPANSETTAGSLFQQNTVRSEICKATSGDVILVDETEDVPLANVAFRLLQSRPDCIELTKRLHTRSDVEWLTLEDIL